MKRLFTKKILKVAGIVLGSLLLLIFGLLIYLDQNVEKIVKSLIEQQYDGSEISRVYKIEYGNIRIGLFSGKVVLKDLKVTPRDSFFLGSDSLRFKYPIVYKVEVPELIIKGLKKNFSLQLSVIELIEIEIRKPAITMIDHLSELEKLEAKKLYQKHEKDSLTDPSKIRQFKLSHFAVVDGQYSLYSKQSQAELLSAGKINIDIRNLDLEPGRIIKTLVTKTFESAEISLAQINYPVPGGFYKIKIGEIKNNVGDRKINIQNLELIPLYDKNEFGVKYGKQIERLQLEVSSLEIDGFDPEKFIAENNIFIRNILIDGLKLEAFRDKNIPFDFEKFPKMPNQALGNLNTGVDIEKIALKNSEIIYEQLNEGIDSCGSVVIKNISASIYNVTNIPEIISARGPMKWDLKADLFGTTELTLEVEFTEDLQAVDFSFWGELKPMDMTAFNDILVNTEFIKIEQGNIRSMVFYADCGEDFSDGYVVMGYDSLRMAILKKIQEKEKTEIGFLSSLANTVIRKFNPGKQQQNAAPDTAAIFFVRDKNKSIFNYLTKSLVSGIKATIIPGISQTKEKFEKKQDKTEKKEIRKKGREERKKKRKEK